MPANFVGLARPEIDEPRIVDRGTGDPLVLVPGIQGRWQWMAPAVHALAQRRRVLTFSLGVPGPRAFDQWAAQLDRLLDRRSIERVALAGVSFGGLLALHYAATRPSRTRALLLVSTPGPVCRLDPTSERYLAHPRLAAPAFALRAMRRLLPEIAAALPTTALRVKFMAEHGFRTIVWPMSPPSMAAWVEAWAVTDLVSDCAAIESPTLVITGEHDLDRVVATRSSLEYVERIRGARHAVLPRTGHVGVVSKPHAFAELVDGFAAGRDVPPVITIPQ